MRRSRRLALSLSLAAIAAMCFFLSIASRFAMPLLPYVYWPLAFAAGIALVIASVGLTGIGVPRHAPLEQPGQAADQPLPSVDKLDFRATYHRLVASLKQSHDIGNAMELAVGGEFEAIGILELETLRHFGLEEDSYVIDVGCGSGRLAKPLSRYPRCRYLGIDVVPELVEHARALVARRDWRFEVAEGLSIPEQDGVADIVCFFSVFTHLLHEQAYVYLQDAKRVLKPGGRVVFSFLDFTIPDHWHVFECNMGDLSANALPLNMFISKDAIRVWAEHLGLSVEAIEDANKPTVPLSEPVIFESGWVLESTGTVGQSVCVLRKDG